MALSCSHSLHIIIIIINLIFFMSKNYYVPQKKSQVLNCFDTRRNLTVFWVSLPVFVIVLPERTAPSVGEKNRTRTSCLSHLL